MTQGGINAKETVALLAFLGMRIDLQEPEVIIENVIRFPASIISEFLGPLYHIDMASIAPTEVGFPCDRDRAFFVLRHRVKTLSARNLLNVFVRILNRNCRTDWEAR